MTPHPLFTPLRALPHAGRLLALLTPLALTLGGCAFAPGMYVHPNVAQETPQKRTTLLTLLQGPSTPEATQEPTQNADAAPAGTLTPITPELIRLQRSTAVPDITPDVQQLFGASKAYTIGAGDVLNIVVWDHPELMLQPAGTTVSAVTDPSILSAVGNGYNVSTDGTIQFPYIGAVKLTGLTEDQARDLISKRLARYIKDPQITLRIQAYRNGRIYLDGEVRSPGLQAVNDIPLTLPEALARAGGLTTLADRSIIAITRGGKTTNVNLQQLVIQGVNPNQILLVAGDLVRVQSREEAKVFVLGEVSRPSTQLLRNGRLTLNEALGDAGGVNPGTGDPRQIFVVRAANSDKPEIYHLDAKSPVAFALAEGFELKSRDVVYVDPVPLVRWNRVISLVLPSAQAVTTTRDASNALK